MRDIFEDIFQNEPTDPTEAARRSLRPKTRAKFYREASAGEAEGAFPLLLDGKPVRTPAGRPLAAPARGIAEAIAAEWNAQRDTIDPATMPLTRLANSTIDGVAMAPAPVADEVAQYLGSDLLFYRAGTPEGLVERQARHWDPILDWARDTLGARFILSEGVVHVAQPEPSLAAVRAAIPGNAWRLGATHVVTTLTGSALLALALAHGHLSAEEAWAAAHVDEDWNMDAWGRDDAAMQRRAFRWSEMQAAARVLGLLSVDQSPTR